MRCQVSGVYLWRDLSGRHPEKVTDWILSTADANTWPTWGALRERILTSCKRISIQYSPGLRDGFPAEIFKLSPPDLQSISFRGCDNLSKFVLSPISSCPSLDDVELADNNGLNYVLMQSNTLATLTIHNCPSLEKVRLSPEGTAKIF
jgi:hypothetical protein